jgi:hypothetical protein
VLRVERKALARTGAFCASISTKNPSAPTFCAMSSSVFGSCAGSPPPAASALHRSLHMLRRAHRVFLVQHRQRTLQLVQHGIELRQRGRLAGSA